MSPIPDDYVDVAERIRQFKEKYPNGSLQTMYEPRVFDFGNRAYIAYCAVAYRTPDDERPGMGWAWEPVPGPTPFTKDSELMNAETSAWGRAIVALGFETKKIASADEVQNRQAEVQPSAAAKPATDGILAELTTVLRLLNSAFPEHPGEGRTWEDVAKGYCRDNFEKESVRDLSLEQANQLIRWLEDQYQQAIREASVPFGEAA